VEVWDVGAVSGALYEEPATPMTPELHRSFALHSGPVLGVAFASDGVTLASYARFPDITIHTWNIVLSNTQDPESSLSVLALCLPFLFREAIQKQTL
jgi:hypothetical protein